ncbi:hypothetical protein [Myxosarcina sp. GI1]|uniref:hypothetical protein n=1 Tax=Myxosarcina sp. GI1 TaxID=1541065 RepID=UPI00068FF56A|nr:hypothetical protein [Myxosarcina sp. GI1]
MLIWFLIIQNIVPEAISILFIIINSINSGISSIYLFFCYSIFLRLVWNSAIILHGLGHTLAIAFVNRQLNNINLNNILEHRSIRDIFKSLLPFNQIFIPLLSSSQPYIAVENSTQLRFKAAGGIAFNLLAVIIFSSYTDNFLGEIALAANLIIALVSLSDLEATVTGVAEYLYCGNFGFIAERNADDGNKLLPERLVKIALQMGRETEIRGEQAGGGLVVARNQDNAVLVGKKIVNRKRANLTKSLEAAFATVRQKATASGIEPLSSTLMGAWHYRYATSGTAPSEIETHWHEWMAARPEKVWQFKDGEWNCQTKNVNHRITHNGDFDSWTLFNKDVDSATLGLWLERILHTPNATRGDSPKIAGIMDLLITNGMWYPSVRLAYQMAIVTSLEETFGGLEPYADTPNTAPSVAELTGLAEILERVFVEMQSSLPVNNSAIPPESLNSLAQRILAKINTHSFTAQWSQLQRTAFVQTAIKAFFNNNLFHATKIFMSKAKGSFGLVTVSTLSAKRLVLSAKGQPITIGFNWQQGYMVYASEPAAVDRVLLGNPQSFRLDLDRQAGEVALVSAKDVAVYSLSQQKLLLSEELKTRWVSLKDHPYLPYIRFAAAGDEDPVTQDINSIPAVLAEIKESWQDPNSLSRRSAAYLAYLLTEKVQRFEKKQQLMFQSGSVSRVRPMTTVDLLITGEENSLWLGERFAKDLRTVFPFLNVVTIDANQLLGRLERDFSQLYLNKDSLILAITQSGQTFSTVQAIDTFNYLCGQGVVGELFILTGELSSFIDATKGSGGLTTITSSTFLGNIGDRRERVFINGSGRRTAEPSTVTTAAGWQTLTELLLYLAKQMRTKFPNSHPFGMTLTQESLQVLAMMKEDFLSKNVPQIMGTTTQGKPIESAIRHKLVRGGRHWSNHITETPLAWAIHALYIIVTVGWVIPFGHTISLVKILSELIFAVFNLPSSWQAAIAPAVTLADIAVYIFGAWLWTLLIRACQGRQLFARMGKRTLVIGDVPWVNQFLQAYVSKLFSLSYGIASLEVHSANPQNHLLHAYGHRVVRGTLIWLGIPDGRRSARASAAENAVLMTGKQANGVRNIWAGAEIYVVGQNPAIARKGFSEAMVLGSNNDEIYFRNAEVIEQKDQIEELRESCFGALERLLASYLFFWALAKKVASFPFLKYEYWKSQSRTKIMTTASPVAGLDASKFDNNKARQESTAKNCVRKS